MAAGRSCDCGRDGGARRVSARRGFARLRALAGFGMPCPAYRVPLQAQGVSRLGCLAPQRPASYERLLLRTRNARCFVTGARVTSDTRRGRAHYFARAVARRSRVPRFVDRRAGGAAPPQPGARRNSTKARLSTRSPGSAVMPASHKKPCAGARKWYFAPSCCAAVLVLGVSVCASMSPHPSRSLSMCVVSCWGGGVSMCAFQCVGWRAASCYCPFGATEVLDGGHASALGTVVVTNSSSSRDAPSQRAAPP